MLALAFFKNLVGAFRNGRKNDLLMAFLTALNRNNRDSRTLPDFSLHLPIPLYL
jgi:hypothetical protein